MKERSQQFFLNRISWIDISSDFICFDGIRNLTEFCPLEFDFIHSLSMRVANTPSTFQAPSSHDDSLSDQHSYQLRKDGILYNDLNQEKEV